ncbi:hypothetical protein CIHG_01507 [Coccidioides immitis H538.4]|uniref:Uncharacterized protein n=3 Tax=Coccidioides immitis TaxID=5501 RepID=A0A0J8QW00_COCIT|nr:hypothetical protein CIRG_01358 [Coccidioides immitis RMSCC 2394]KMU75503.1 hypothetical protein CISG_05136 [Coccidioides immitis RMSCC 3703]KMU83724.1 hypothetical protein CIHG_01507 [Coccidioides immitis H538.4]
MTSEHVLALGSKGETARKDLNGWLWSTLLRLRCIIMSSSAFPLDYGHQSFREQRLCDQRNQHASAADGQSSPKSETSFDGETENARLSFHFGRMVTPQEF